MGLIIIAVAIFFLMTATAKGFMLKSGVNLNGVRPQVFYAIEETRRIYERHGVEFVITSLVDGDHGFGSLHFVGLAVDFRTRHISFSLAKTIADEVRTALGQQYDVVNHIKSPRHLHVEYQPKQGVNL